MPADALPYYIAAAAALVVFLLGYWLGSGRAPANLKQVHVEIEDATFIVGAAGADDDDDDDEDEAEAWKRS